MPAPSSYKPAGYTSVAASLIVADAESFLGFVRAVFGAEPPFLHRRDDGSIAHAEVRIDDTIVMCGQSEGVPRPASTSTSRTSTPPSREPSRPAAARASRWRKRATATAAGESPIPPEPSGGSRRRSSRATLKAPLSRRKTKLLYNSMA